MSGLEITAYGNEYILDADGWRIGRLAHVVVACDDAACSWPAGHGPCSTPTGEVVAHSWAADDVARAHRLLPEPHFSPAGTDAWPDPRGQLQRLMTAPRPPDRLDLEIKAMLIGLPTRGS